jgi:hypothetical protein
MVEDALERNMRVQRKKGKLFWLTKVCYSMVVEEIGNSSRWVGWYRSNDRVFWWEASPSLKRGLRWRTETTDCSSSMCCVGWNKRKDPWVGWTKDANKQTSIGEERRQQIVHRPCVASVGTKGRILKLAGRKMPTKKPQSNEDPGWSDVRLMFGGLSCWQLPPKWSQEYVQSFD